MSDLKAIYYLAKVQNNYKQEDHDGPISLIWVLTCDPWGGASFDPGASNEQTW